MKDTLRSGVQCSLTFLIGIALLIVWSALLESPKQLTDETESHLAITDEEIARIKSLPVEFDRFLEGLPATDDVVSLTVRSREELEEMLQDGEYASSYEKKIAAARDRYLEFAQQMTRIMESIAEIEKSDHQIIQEKLPQLPSIRLGVENLRHVARVTAGRLSALLGIVAGMQLKEEEMLKHYQTAAQLDPHNPEYLEELEKRH